MILEQTQAFFGQDSPLKDGSDKRRDFSYEPRPQQVAMAEAIGAAFDAGENLCVEAPTGVGKTFAYLIPAVFQAMLHDQPVLVSTHTIHLQEQILQRDIPFLEELIGQPLKATVAKGRSNYLCLRKLNEIADMDQEMLPGADALDDIAKLVKWAEETESGDYGDMSESIAPSLWDAVCSERGNCMGNRCPFFASCFLFKARRRIGNAKIIVTNHAFFFSALAMEHEDLPEVDKNESKLLPALSAVIIDEAHTLEDSAANHLAMTAETFVVNKALNRLFSSDRNKGVLSDPAFGTAREAVRIAKHKADVFFAKILQWLEPQDKNPLRYTIPNHIPSYLDEPLQEVTKALDELMIRLEDEELKTEIKGLRQTLEEQRIAMNTFFGMTEKEYVYWMEIIGRNHQDLAFHSVPVNVAPLLHEKLFTRPPVIMTSATLAVNNDLSFFLSRIGAEDARRLILDTPFDFEKQVHLYIAQNMPEPKSGDFLAESIPYLKHFLKQTDGRAFVLFTSYRSLNDTAKKLESFCDEEHYTILKQGDGLSPRRMLQQFRKTRKAIIFGTASFWTGVDVPGDALSNVIITKLPFSVPDHPLVEARSERAQALGQNDFMEYSVPEAVLKFRQGFGRLIRSKTDTGIVVILDSRVISKYYGRIFLQSIPHCPVDFV